VVLEVVLGLAVVVQEAGTLEVVLEDRDEIVKEGSEGRSQDEEEEDGDSLAGLLGSLLE